MAFENKVQQSSVENFLTLYELDLRKLGGEIYRFHGHNDGIITWQGQSYTPIAITSDGLEMRGDGKAVRLSSPLPIRSMASMGRYQHCVDCMMILPEPNLP